MDTLHSVLRSIRGETKSRRNHLDVFREFLDHLDRAARRRQPAQVADDVPTGGSLEIPKERPRGRATARRPIRRWHDGLGGVAVR